MSDDLKQNETNWAVAFFNYVPAAQAHAEYQRTGDQHPLVAAAFWFKGANPDCKWSAHRLSAVFLKP